MRSNAPFSLFVTMLVVAGSALAPQAQETNSSGQRVPPVNRRPQPPPGPARLMEGLGPIVPVLTEEQLASMAQALQSRREKVRELEMKIRSARRALFEAGLAGKFDEETVRRQAQAVSSLEAERTVLGLKALSEVQPPLTAEQIERIKNALPVMPGRLGPGNAIRESRAARGRTLTNTNRDENDLPPKR